MDTAKFITMLEFLFSEPGYYEDGNFGIRLENVLIVKDADTRFNFGDKGYLSFEHITWVSWWYIHIKIPPDFHVLMFYAQNF